MRIEKISAVTPKVASMRTSVRFYKDVLGMEIVFGGEEAFFSSLRAKDANTPILNLEQGHSVPGWGRMIFYGGGCGCVLGIPTGKRIKSRASARRLLGRAVFPYV
jgi:hypothetical protein